MIKEICIFSFNVVIHSGKENIIDKLCYCYGNIYGIINKSGIMNLIRSPFLLNIFLDIIDKIKNEYDIQMVSDIKSITLLNNYLIKNNLKQILDIIDINSFISLCNTYKCTDESMQYINAKQIYYLFIKIKYSYPKYQVFIIKNGEKIDENKEFAEIFIRGMEFALEFPLDALKIISKHDEKFLIMETSTP